jgi:hypothetical protein
MKGGFTVTGWRSKKMLTDRDLVDDIITLRRQLAEAERQRDNALDAAVAIRKAILEIYCSSDDVQVQTNKIAARALNMTETE